jgi:hypothetical protein
VAAGFVHFKERRRREEEVVNVYFPWREQNMCSLVWRD